MARRVYRRKRKSGMGKALRELIKRNKLDDKYASATINDANASRVSIGWNYDVTSPSNFYYPTISQGNSYATRIADKLNIKYLDLSLLFYFAEGSDSMVGQPLVRLMVCKSKDPIWNGGSYGAQQVEANVLKLQSNESFISALKEPSTDVTIVHDVVLGNCPNAGGGPRSFVYKKRVKLNQDLLYKAGGVSTPSMGSVFFYLVSNDPAGAASGSTTNAVNMSGVWRWVFCDE